jgi:hypothetical protein
MFYDVNLLGKRASLYVIWSAGITGAKKLHKTRVMAQDIAQIWYVAFQQ